MKKTVKILFLSVLTFVLSISFVIVNKVYALETYVIGEDVDFANSQGQGVINTELQADGKIKTTLKTINPSGVRMYYAADGTEQYRVNLTNFTFNYTIDAMETNASYKIAFLKNWDDFPLDQWGTGLAFLMENDNGGAYNVLPYLYTSGVGQTQLSDKNWYLVYDNSTRPSHLGKSITFKSEDAGDNLLITMKFDEVSGNPVTYGNYFPKSYFIERGMDVTSVLFMFGVNNNNSKDFEFTINELTDFNKENYNVLYGNAARELFNEVKAIDSLNLDTSIKAIHRFFHLQKEVAATSNLRKSDRYLKTQAINKWNSLENAYINAVIEKKVELFGIYDEAFEVTAENLESVNSSLLVYNSAKTILNDPELDERMELLLLKIVALDYQDEITALENSISEFLELYQSVTAETYLQAKSDYQTILDEFNSFEEQFKQFIKNGPELLGFVDTLVAGKDLYYSNENTKWISYDANLHTARMTINEGTKIILMDSFGDVRVVYGDDNSDYLVSIEDFTLVFSIDDLNYLGRFAINFGEHREMLPNATVGKQGISIVFRSTSTNAIDIALKDTATDEGLTFGTPLDSWGKYGTISATTLRGSEITMKFRLVSSNYKLTFTVEEGVGFEVEVPARYFNDRNLNVNALVLNITPGEGANHNNGDDIELTIKELKGKNETLYEEMVSNFVTTLEEVEILHSKLTQKTITSIELNAYINKIKLTDFGNLRSYDKTVYQNRYDLLEIDNVNTRVANYVDEQLEAIEIVVTKENYEELKAQLLEIEKLFNVLSEEQKTLLTHKEKLSSAKTNVKAYEKSLEVEDPIEEPEEPKPDQKLNLLWLYISIGALVVVVGVIVTVLFIKKKR